MFYEVFEYDDGFQWIFIDVRRGIHEEGWQKEKKDAVAEYQMFYKMYEWEVDKINQF